MQMGIGPLGAPDVIIKRKFRWTLEISTPCGNLPPYTAKTAARPHVEIEETELNFLNAVTWLPGKAKWQPISITYYDVANSSLQGLMNWVATIYDFTDVVNLRMSEKRGWAGTGLLMIYDGCGSPLEAWYLGTVWPTSVNFGDLDYASTDFCTVDLTIRYSEVNYVSFCGGVRPVSCCKGCFN
jgi:hypothetical protein